MTRCEEGCHSEGKSKIRKDLTLTEESQKKLQWELRSFAESYSATFVQDDTVCTAVVVEILHFVQDDTVRKDVILREKVKSARI